MFRPVEVTPLPRFRLRLKYEDGAEGVVDVSHLKGKGVFGCWDQPGVFEKVSIGQDGAVRWNDDVELCPDALYLEITGRSPEDVFSSSAETPTNAGN